MRLLANHAISPSPTFTINILDQAYTCKLLAEMACFLPPFPLLCFLAACIPAVRSIRPYPSTPFPTYCTVDPITGVCRYPQPVPDCPLIARIRGFCSPLPPVPTPPVSIALPPSVCPAPAPAHNKILDAFDLPPWVFSLGPQAFILTPPEELSPLSPPIYGLPIDQPLPPQLPPPFPAGGPQPPSVLPPEYVGLPVEFPIPNQPPLLLPSEPGPSMAPPLEAPPLSTTPSLPALPPTFSELPTMINPSPP